MAPSGAAHLISILSWRIYVRPVQQEEDSIGHALQSVGCLGYAFKYRACLAWMKDHRVGLELGWERGYGCVVAGECRRRHASSRAQSPTRPCKLELSRFGSVP
jgi:hypothetical protein